MHTGKEPLSFYPQEDAKTTNMIKYYRCMVRLIFESLQLQTIMVYCFSWAPNDSNNNSAGDEREYSAYEFEARKRIKRNKVGCMVGGELGSTLHEFAPERGT